MSQEDLDQLHDMARPAPVATGLTIYGHQDFAGGVARQGRAVVGALSARGVVIHESLRYQGFGSTFVVVASSTPGDLEAMRHYVLSNMSLEVARDHSSDLRGQDPRAVLWARTETGMYR